LTCGFKKTYAPDPSEHREAFATDPRAKGLESGCGGLIPHEKNVGGRCHLITRRKLRPVRDFGCISDD
jgi:hypothetical protein